MGRFMFFIAFSLFIFRSSRYFDNGSKTRPFKYPHRKKSHAFKSGDRGGDLDLLMNFRVILYLKDISIHIFLARIIILDFIYTTMLL